MPYTFLSLFSLQHHPIRIELTSTCVRLLLNVWYQTTEKLLIIMRLSNLHNGWMAYRLNVLSFNEGLFYV